MTDIVERLRDRAKFFTAISPYELNKEAADEITRLRSALSEAENERDDARIWRLKAKTFLEELSDTRLRAENAEAELAKARAQFRETVERMADDINVLRAELAQARTALETVKAVLDAASDECVGELWVDDFTSLGAFVDAALITDPVRTEGEQK